MVVSSVSSAVTLFLPFCLDKYIALSARWMKVESSSFSAYWVAPMLIVIDIFFPFSGRNTSSWTTLRILSATSSASSQLVSGNITVNSSPPYRTTQSIFFRGRRCSSNQPGSSRTFCSPKNLSSPFSWARRNALRNRCWK